VKLRHEGVWGSGGIGLTIPNLASKWRLVVSITPWQLYPRKELLYALKRGLGGTQSRSERFRAEKNLLRLSGMEPMTAGKTRNLSQGQ